MPSPYARLLNIDEGVLELFRTEDPPRTEDLRREP